MRQWRFLLCWLVGTAAVATAAARFAVWKESRQKASAVMVAAAKDAENSQDSEARFHDWIHANLNITASQHEALSATELEYGTHRKSLRDAVEKANEELAATIKNSSVFQGEVEAALDRLATAQRALQRATLDHFFSMKQSLTLAQQEKLLLWTHDSLLNH